MVLPTDKLDSQTREEIDTKLEAASWLMQDKKTINQKPDPISIFAC